MFPFVTLTRALEAEFEASELRRQEMMSAHVGTTIKESTEIAQTVAAGVSIPVEAKSKLATNVRLASEQHLGMLNPSSLSLSLVPCHQSVLLSPP